MDRLMRVLYDHAGKIVLICLVAQLTEALYFSISVRWLGHTLGISQVILIVSGLMGLLAELALYAALVCYAVRFVLRGKGRT